MHGWTARTQVIVGRWQFVRTLQDRQSANFGTRDCVSCGLVDRARLWHMPGVCENAVRGVLKAARRSELNEFKKDMIWTGIWVRSNDIHAFLFQYKLTRIKPWFPQSDFFIFVFFSNALFYCRGGKKPAILLVAVLVFFFHGAVRAISCCWPQSV
jgi:hypothetical protein